MKKRIFFLGAAMLAACTLPYSAEAAQDTFDGTASFRLVAPTETLKITNATNLVFSDATISASDVVTTTTGDASISVQELSGNATGWTLQVELGVFADGTKTIPGAELFYPSVTPTTTTPGDVSNILPTAVATDTAFQGTATGKIISSGGAASTLVSAAQGKGYGSWTMTYGGADKIQLKIPTGQLAGNYVADLTYTLTDSPTP